MTKQAIGNANAFGTEMTGKIPDDLDKNINKYIKNVILLK